MMMQRAAVSMGLEGLRVDAESARNDTPLDDEILSKLSSTSILTQHQLNLAEAECIAATMSQVYKSPAWTNADHLLTESTLIDLHRLMFGELWEWAGKYRAVNTNLGSPWTSVRSDTVNLVENYRFQVLGDQALPYPADEVAVRFHHLLVRVHPFADGNGRHARLVADLLVSSLGQPIFSWGGLRALEDGTGRDTYIAAIKHADREFEYGPLMEFARSQ